MSAKYRHAMLAVMACAGMVESSAQATLLGEASGFNPPRSADANPYVFTTYGLDVKNTVQNGVSQFSASSLVANNGDLYTSPLSSSVTPFSGTFNLTANLAQNNGVWHVQSGSFSIDGNLTGQGMGDILLTGSLESGLVNGREADANGKGGFGYNANTFEFIFAVTGGDPTIVKEFFGTGALNNVLITVPSWYAGTSFDGTSLGLAKPFDIGIPIAYANSYAPEPTLYGLVASAIAAGAGLIMVCHRERAGDRRISIKLMKLN